VQLTISLRPTASSAGAFRRVLAQPARAIAAFVDRDSWIAYRVYSEYIDAIFEREGQPPWKTLVLPTILHRLYLGFPPEHPILYRTGSFKESLQGRGIIESIKLGNNSKMLRYGTNDPRFLWFQEGTRYMPARPIAPTQARYKKAFGRNLAKGLGAALNARVQEEWGK